MTTKQRAFLIHLAAGENTILHIGKGGLTPETEAAVDEAVTARELVKIGIQQNCPETAAEIAQKLSECTHAEIVQIIGRKIVLYREGRGKKKKIDLPSPKKERASR